MIPDPDNQNGLLAQARSVQAVCATAFALWFAEAQRGTT